MQSIDESVPTADVQPLPGRAQVLVIGGGVVGCSVLYHLTKKGLSNVVLVEKNYLTSGSSWHAAGMLSQYHADRVHLEIIRAGTALYHEFEKDPETAVGLHSSGDLKIARSEAEMDDLRRWSGVARTVGLPAFLVGPERVKELFPLLETQGIVGGMWFPTSGFVDPSQTTHSFARQARQSGARIFQQCAVEAITRNKDGTWLVSTKKGTINADTIVNCAGVWAEDITSMIGETIPAIGIEHQMMIFESIPEVKALDFELPMIHDPATPIYTRADRDGLILSSYPDTTIFFGKDGVPADFAGELLPPEFDRGEGKIATAMEMIPALQNVGVRAFVNGAIPRSYDRVPMVGPLHGYNNFFLSCSNYGGFLFAALGQYLAEWIVDGEPSVNLTQMDPRRFGDYADRHYAIKMLEGAGKAHTGALAPSEDDTDLPKGAGPVWTSPCYGLLKAKRAVFEMVAGWEVPKWFARPGDDTRDLPVFMKPNWLEAVGEERRSLLRGVGIADLTSYGKFEISGPGARDYVNHRLAVHAPGLHRVVQAPALNKNGGLVGIWSVSQPQENVYYVTGTARHARRDLDSLRWEAFGDITITDLSRDKAVLALAGPRAIDVIRALGWRSASGSPDLPQGAEDGRIGYVPARLVRTLQGKVEMFELHVRMEYQAGLYERLLDAGADVSIRDVGSCALASIRIEAGIPTPGTDIDFGSDPRDAGPFGAIDLDKADFVGKSAMLARQPSGHHRLATFEIDAPTETLPVIPTGDEPLLLGDNCIGYVTSATSTSEGRVVGFAQVRTDANLAQAAITVQILEKAFTAKVHA